MAKGTRKLRLPVFVEKDEDGIYVVECPVLKGCYTQGKTLDEVMKNIHEVIKMCLEEQREEIVGHLDKVKEFSFHTVSVEI